MCSSKESQLNYDPPEQCRKNKIFTSYNLYIVIININDVENGLTVVNKIVRNSQVLNCV